MKSKIEVLIMRLERDKHNAETGRNVCYELGDLLTEQMHSSRALCLDMVIKELKKILNDSSAPIRPNEADKESA